MASIYERRGLSPRLAREVAIELSVADQLAVHGRDELGINPDELANPVQASVVSALSFFAAGFARGDSFFFRCLILLTFFPALGARLGFGLRFGLAMSPLDEPG